MPAALSKFTGVPLQQVAAQMMEAHCCDIGWTALAVLMLFGGVRQLGTWKQNIMQHTHDIQGLCSADGASMSATA